MTLKACYKLFNNTGDAFIILCLGSIKCDNVISFLLYKRILLERK